jgi:hypothetical protein
MANKTYIIGWSAFGVLAILAIYLWWVPKVSWEENLNPDLKDPYGTFMLHQLLESVRSDQGFVFVDDSLSNRLPPDPSSNVVDNYVFIGERFYGGVKDQKAVLDFVSNGNKVFILVEDPEVFFRILFDGDEHALQDTVAEEVAEESDEMDESMIAIVTDTLLRMSVMSVGNSEHQFNLSKYNEHKVVARTWEYFILSQQDYTERRIETIGTFDGYEVNAFAIPYGKGKIYFHSQPLVFCNYYIKQKLGMLYCRAFMSHLGNGVVYWDEENRHFQFPDQTENGEQDGPLNKPEEGPLEFILSQRSLRTAWYLMLATVLLYAIFAGRRKQRAIRTIKPLRNTSIEFAEVVSNLFLKQSDHSKLVRMKMELWRAHARERYRMKWVDTPFLMTLEGVPELSLKSGIPEKIITELIEKYNSVMMTGSVDTEAMLDLHNKLEFYYQNCK